MELFEEFSLLVNEFKKEKIDYALCGGLAMAVYAYPRATLDIDILIEPETFGAVLSVRPIIFPPSKMAFALCAKYDNHII